MTSPVLERSRQSSRCANLEQRDAIACHSVFDGECFTRRSFHFWADGKRDSKRGVTGRQRRRRRRFEVRLLHPAHSALAEPLLLQEAETILKASMALSDISTIVHSTVREGRDYRAFRTFVLLGTSDANRTGPVRGATANPAAAGMNGTVASDGVLAVACVRVHEDGSGTSEGKGKGRGSGGGSVELPTLSQNRVRRAAEVVVCATRGRARRQGYGQLLMAAVKAACTAAECSAMYVNASREAAVLGFWRACSFVGAGGAVDGTSQSNKSKLTGRHAGLSWAEQQWVEQHCACFPDTTMLTCRLGSTAVRMLPAAPTMSAAEHMSHDVSRGTASSRAYQGREQRQERGRKRKPPCRSGRMRAGLVGACRPKRRRAPCGGKPHACAADCDKLVASRAQVRRHFARFGWFSGRVLSWRWVTSNTTSSSSVNTPHQEPWFLVRYSDGDEEEVDWHTLHHILLAPDHLSEQPAVSMSTREQVTGQGGAAGGSGTSCSTKHRACVGRLASGTQVYVSWSEVKEGECESVIRCGCDSSSDSDKDSGSDGDISSGSGSDSDSNSDRNSDSDSDQNSGGTSSNENRSNSDDKVTPTGGTGERMTENSWCDLARRCAIDLLHAWAQRRREARRQERRAKRRAQKHKMEQERRQQKQVQEQRAEEARRKRLQRQRKVLHANPLSAGGNSLVLERELWGPVGSLFTTGFGANTSSCRLSTRQRALATKIRARMAQQEAKWDKACARK